MAESSERATVLQEDMLRADLYGFLGALLTSPPDAALLETARSLEGGDSGLGKAVSVLARLAASTGPEAVTREFNRLFIGLARGELVPYASYYMTGFLNEKPLAVLRNDMAALGIERKPGVYEPEDNIGSLCEMMAGLIRGTFGAPASLSRQRDFFNRHLRPWAAHFFSDLERAESSAFYVPVGTIGRLFMEIEAEAFRMAGESAA